jgi:hypothetical protein
VAAIVGRVSLPPWRRSRMLRGVPSLLGDVGTIEWSRRTNGILGRGERARFMAAATLTIARVLPRLLAARAGWRGSGPDPSALTPPDTAVTRDVLAACADLDPMLVEHGYRSYVYARALGVVDGLTCDDEALFAATMLHDVAFAHMDAFSGKCFTLVGAEAADDVLAATALPADLRHAVLDAITLHFNPSVGPERGALQHLVHDGIVLDVLGARGWQLDPGGVRRVQDQHPRHAFTLRGEPLLRVHRRRTPGGRVDAMFRCGFAPALRTSPWRSLERRDVATAADAAADAGAADAAPSSAT